MARLTDVRDDPMDPADRAWLDRRAQAIHDLEQGEVPKQECYARAVNELIAFRNSHPAFIQNLRFPPEPEPRVGPAEKTGLELVFVYELQPTMTHVRVAIKRCEGQHVQQIAYSSYMDALTQVCFTCRVIRSTILWDGGKSWTVGSRRIEDDPDPRCIDCGGSLLDEGGHACPGQ